MQKVQNLIIGAGPAGLAVAGRMREMGIHFGIIEQSDRIACRWHQHYDRLHLHTIKELSHLPHLPFPEDFPRYVPRARLLEYYEGYARHFDIHPQFGLEVTQIHKDADNWLVDTRDGKRFMADQVIIASGANRLPNTPRWKGQENFKGNIMHSRDYKNADPYIGLKVLVIGMGNTGAEIALDLCEKKIDTTLSVRSPVCVVPRDVNGRPVQSTARLMAKLPFGLGDWLGVQISKLVIGDLSKYGLPMTTMPPAVLLRETGKTPVIDIGTVKQIKMGNIKVVGAVENFYEKGVKLKDHSKLKVDAIILATGYRAQLTDFIENAEVLLDQYGLPDAPISEGYHSGLYFVGFDNYKLGGILGTIYNDSKVVVDDISKRINSGNEAG